MHRFTGPKERLVLLYIVGFVTVTVVTRAASQRYPPTQPIVSTSSHLNRIEETMDLFRPAMAALHSSDAITRANGAARLNILGPRASLATIALSEALADPDRTVRANAAQALGNIGRYAFTAVPALTDALHDPDSTVRIRAIEALGKIGYCARPAVGTLAAIRSSAAGPERSAAALALKRIDGSCHTPGTRCNRLLFYRKNAARALQRGR
jgi:hypothetical protein